LDLLLEQCREGGWLKAHGRQRTDSTHILAKIRSPPPHLTRCPDDGLRVEWADHEVAPDWIRSHVPVEWVQRYGQRLPKEEQEHTQSANQVGTDGWMLLDARQIG
jgi:transposase